MNHFLRDLKRRYRTHIMKMDMNNIPPIIPPKKVADFNDFSTYGVNKLFRKPIIDIIPSKKLTPIKTSTLDIFFKNISIIKLINGVD